jgi:cysteine desulfurase
MQPYLCEYFGNPSSDHVFGRTCKLAVETSRAHVATLLNCDSDEVCFTSCGTESDNCELKYSPHMVP